MALLFGLLFAAPLPRPVRVPAARVVELHDVRKPRRPWALATLALLIVSCAPAPRSAADLLRSAAPIADAAVREACLHAGQAAIDDAASGLLSATEAQARLDRVHATCRQIESGLREVANGAR